MTVPSGSPLNYPVNSQAAIRRVAENRAPTANDYKNFREGDEWLDKTSDDWWKLADITQQTALWVKIGGTGSALESFIPDSGTDPVVPDASNQITTTGANGLTVIGGTNTLTFSTTNGELATKFLPDTGTTPVVPDSSGEVTLAGGSGITTTGGLNTVTFDVDGSVITTQYDGDTGSATPTAGVLNIIGGNGTVTSAATNSVVCEMQSPFVGDFSFESNTGAATETLTVQNTIDQADSAAVVDIKIAGSTSDYAQWRIASEALGSFAGQINAAGDGFSLDYLNDDNVTPSTRTNQIFRVDNINTTSGYSRIVKPGELVVAEEGTGIATIGINSSNETGIDAILQLIQTNGTDDCRIQFSGGSSANWTIGTYGADSSNLYITNAPITLWPPDAANTFAFIENALTGSWSMTQTGALIIPRGTTGERPGTPVNGMIRYNTTTAKFEGYEAGAWANLI